MVFAHSLLNGQHENNSVEKELASSFFVSLEKPLHGIPPSPPGKQAVEPSVLPIVVAQFSS